MDFFSKLQRNDKTVIYILEKITDWFFLLTKQITSYPYKIDIENQLEVSAAEKEREKLAVNLKLSQSEYKKS